MATHVHLAATAGVRLRRGQQTIHAPILRAIRWALAATRRRLAHHRAAATLRSLDDRMLDDIGLTRADIAEAVDGLGVAAERRRHRLR